MMLTWSISASSRSDSSRPGASAPDRMDRRSSVMTCSTTERGSIGRTAATAGFNAAESTRCLAFPAGAGRQLNLTPTGPIIPATTVITYIGCTFSDHVGRRTVASDTQLLIRGVTVVDPRDGSVRPGQDVRIDGETIVSVAAAGDGDVPAGVPPPRHPDPRPPAERDRRGPGVRRG